jgi:hypothetical protein
LEVVVGLSEAAKFNDAKISVELVATEWYWGELAKIFSQLISGRSSLYEVNFTKNPFNYCHGCMKSYEVAFAGNDLWFRSFVPYVHGLGFPSKVMLNADFALCSADKIAPLQSASSAVVAFNGSSPCWSAVLR